MNDIVTRWRRRPDDLEAGLVAEHTAQKIALWCGGVVNRERDRGVDEYLELVVPNVEGNQKAHVNDYVVRKSDGRFYVMTMADMNDYEELGFGKKRDLVAEQDARLKEVVGDDFKIAEKFTPHYVPRNSPYSNER